MKMIRNFLSPDGPALLDLWNRAGTQLGFAPMDREQFERLFLKHPYFSSEYTFILEEKGKLLGFVNGCTGDSIPRGGERGYVSCLILEKEADTEENTEQLLRALECAFRAAGRQFSAVTFFNPIRLPWMIPGTPGHQHNNAPGIATDIPLYERMLSLGYREAARENAMYLDLGTFTVPDRVEEKARAMAAKGYTVAPYDPRRHQGLEEMLDSLHNPLWCQEIPEAVRQGREVLVGLFGTTVAGFTGPIYPEDTGRGYFSGIGVAPQFEHNGLGSLLFYRLCQRERETGAEYMSLFTGEDNPALHIYLGAGFRVCRSFGVMLKNLEE